MLLSVHSATVNQWGAGANQGSETWLSGTNGSWKPYLNQVQRTFKDCNVFVTLSLWAPQLSKVVVGDHCACPNGILRKKLAWEVFRMVAHYDNSKQIIILILDYETPFRMKLHIWIRFIYYECLVKIGNLLNIIIKTDTYLVEKLSSTWNTATGDGYILWHKISLSLPKHFIFSSEGRLHIFPQYHIKQEGSIIHSDPSPGQSQHQIHLCCKRSSKETFIYLKYFYP